MTPTLRVLGDRVLIVPDMDDRAPEAMPSGVVIAQSLAAAVTGTDPMASWCRGTVVAVGMPRHPLRDEALDLAARLAKLAAAAPSSTNAELLTDATETLQTLVQRDPCVSVGDDVLFAHDAGQEVQMAHQTMILLHEHELLAIVS